VSNGKGSGSIYDENVFFISPPNVSQELTGDAVRFAGHGASAGAEKSRPGSEPRQLSSRLLG